MVQLAGEQIKAIMSLALGDDVTHAERVAVTRAFQHGQRPTITWAQPAPGVHTIDHAGRLLRVFSELAGLAAARAAMASPGQRTARATEFCEPGPSTAALP